MAIVDARTGMEHLPGRECWELLRAVPVGRIGVLLDGAPEVYPVTHAVDGTSIVFRTDRGGKLHGLDRTPAVCFEVDAFDRAARSGWSVLAKGRAQLVTSAGEVAALESLALEPWGTGAKVRWVRITVDEVTGRRLLPPSGGR